MALPKNKNSNVSSPNFRPADAWARPKLVVRNSKTGKIVSELRFGSDIPLNINTTNESATINNMIAKAQTHPDHEFEVKMSIYVPTHENRVDLDDESLVF